MSDREAGTPDAVADSGDARDPEERHGEPDVPRGEPEGGRRKPEEGAPAPEPAGPASGTGRRPPRVLDTSLRNEALPEHARCPFCGGRDTEQFSAFGSAVSTSQYYCRRCRTVFEFMKRRGE